MRGYERKETPTTKPERWVLPALGKGHSLPDIDWTSNVAVERFLDADDAEASPT